VYVKLLFLVNCSIATHFSVLEAKGRKATDLFVLIEMTSNLYGFKQYETLLMTQNVADLMFDEQLSSGSVSSANLYHQY
jgi:hypothetical protein